MNINDLIVALIEMKDQGISEISIINSPKLINNRPFDSALKNNNDPYYTEITLNITPSCPITLSRLKILLDVLKRKKGNALKESD